MAERIATSAEDAAPEPAEQVHLPGPSYLPAWVAFGITIALVGVIMTWVIVAIGAIIAVVAIARWVKETREDIAQLPLDH
jgi:hypothetical protein